MNKTILIIDDDDTLRQSLANGLNQADFSTLTANSAEQGAEILSRVTVDAIILDRMMGGTDGLTFLKKLRESGNLTPIIMLTALSGPENTIDGLANGANDYLAKPFQLKELVLRLQNIIKQNTQQNSQNLPDGLIFADNEFFVKQPNDDTRRLFMLSGEEKKLLHNLINPIGNVVATSPMVAKRLRTKINSVLSNIDIVTIRGRGYKLITIPITEKR